MGTDHAEILADAIARNSAAVLSLPSAGMIRHHKSRFLAQTAEGVWIESAAGELPLIRELLEQRTSVGISFKAPPNKASFAVPILRIDPAYRINAQATVEALLVQTPDKIKPVQRRNNYRVHVPEDAGLSVKVWRIADHVLIRDKPLASQQMNVQTKDISVGGMGIVISANPHDTRKLCPGQRLRIELKIDSTELILEGVLRMSADITPVSSVKAGIQFKRLENDLAGRQAMAALTRIVGQFQLEEVRQNRLAS
jgi:hypothetical protein